MKAEDFYKTQEELKKKIQKNDEQIDINDEKKRMSCSNQFENKVSSTFILSSIPYLGLTILSGILALTGVMSSIAGIIPVESFPLIFIGGPLCIGNIGRRILEKKYRIKERIKAFSKAKTESEKIQEEVKYAIELEKAYNRNKAIEKTIDTLSLNQSILNSLSDRYDINDRNNPTTKEEAKKRVENFSKLLEEKNAELDVLSTQQVLHEKFWKVRMNGSEFFVNGLFGGFFSMIFGLMPVAFFREYITYTVTAQICLFSPLVIGCIGVGGYMIKRSKNYKKAFNNLNKELGEKALPDKIKDAYVEQQDLDDKIESKIKEVCAIETKLQESKRAMELFMCDSNDNQEAMETLVDKEQTLESSQKSTISEYNQGNMFTRMDEEVVASQEKGPSLGLKRR